MTNLCYIEGEYNGDISMQDDDIQRRLDHLAGNDKLKQRQAFDYIKRTSDPCFVDGLIDHLMHDDDTVRQDCVVLLGHIGDAEATPILIHMFNNRRHEPLHKHIIIALGRIGDAEAVDLLLELLDTYVDHLLREDVIRALGYAGDSRAESALIDLVESDNVFVRQRLAEALATFDSSLSVNSLIVLIGDDERRVRTKAAQSLGQIANPTAIPALDMALDDRESSVRQAVVRALANMNDPAIIEPLCYALEDNNYTTRKIAADKLGNIGTPLAYEPLLKAKNTYKDPALDRAINKLSGKFIRSADVDTTFLIDMLPVHPQPEGILKTLESIGTPEALSAVERWHKTNNTESNE